MQKIIFSLQIKYAPKKNVASIENGIITMHQGFELETLNLQKISLTESLFKSNAGNRVKQDLKINSMEAANILKYEDLPLIFELPTESHGIRVLGSLNLPANIINIEGNAPDVTLSIRRLSKSYEFQS